MPAPTTTTSKGSPPLLLTSGQLLHIQRPRTSWEKAVCWTSTRTCGSALRRGSMDASYGGLRSSDVQQGKLSTAIPTTGKCSERWQALNFFARQAVARVGKLALVDLICTLFDDAEAWARLTERF